MKSFISTFENVALRKRILRDGLLSDMSDNSRYQNLVAAYHKAYLSGTKQSRLIAAQTEWNRVKKSSQDYDQLMLSLKSKAAKRESMAFQWWAQSRKACMFVYITFFIELRNL